MQGSGDRIQLGVGLGEKFVRFVMDIHQTIIAVFPVEAAQGGNGYTGTVVGADNLTSVPGVIGNGLYFSGAAADNYVSVPNASNGTSLSGMNTLTLSAWINVPAASYNGVRKMVFSWDDGDATPYTLGTWYPPGLPNSRGLTWNLNENVSDAPWADPSGNKGFYRRTDGTGYAAGTWQLLTVEYYGGNSSTAIGFDQLYVNGIYVGGGECGSPAPPNGAKPLPSAATGQNLRIGDYPGQEWYGGLNDLGIWNVNLTGAASFSTMVAGDGDPGVSEARQAERSQRFITRRNLGSLHYPSTASRRWTNCLHSMTRQAQRQPW